MKRQTPTRQLSFLVAVGMLAFILTAVTVIVYAAGPVIDPVWTYNLPAKSCPGTSITHCHYGSPVLADLNNDGRLDVIAVTNNGHVVAVRHDGVLLWNRDIADFLNSPPNSQEIHSSPAVADIDGDNQPEIVVGIGTRYGDVCTKGGLIVLNHNGYLESGNWPQYSGDEIPPWGCPDGIISTPALGNLDSDDQLEIVAGGFDKRIYAWNHNGTMLNGFPPDSYHRLRFPDWTQLDGKLTDTIWSSPALADLDGDGFLDIIIGTDEGNYDASFPGNANGWTCPYAPPPNTPAGYCGGSLYALNRFGTILPGFPIYLLETIQSTPVIADANRDGFPEIYFGAGEYYFNQSPDRPEYGFRLHGRDHQGNILPGWNDFGDSFGGKQLNDSAATSPVIGDIAGSSKPEIIILAQSGTLYAFHDNGQPVSGFPMIPRNQNGQPAQYSVGYSLTLADYDGDGKMEILLNHTWLLVVVDGNGQQLTTSNYPADPRPLFITTGSLLNVPAVGDIDNDNRLEVVSTNSRITTWELSNSTTEADWPMFKQDAARLGVSPSPATLVVLPHMLSVFHPQGNPGNAQAILSIRNVGSESFNWSAASPVGVNINFNPSSGVLSPGSTAQVLVTIPTHTAGSLGDIIVTATVGGQAAVNSPALIPVTLYIGNMGRIYLPAVRN